MPGLQVQYYTALSDANGNVHFDVRDYYGQNEVIVDAEGSKGASYKVDVNNFSNNMQYRYRIQPG